MTEKTKPLPKRKLRELYATTLVKLLAGPDSGNYPTELLPVWADQLTIDPADDHPYTVLYDPQTDTVIGSCQGRVILVGSTNNPDGVKWDLSQLFLLANTDQQAFNTWRKTKENGGAPDTGSAGNGNGHT